MQLYKPSVKDVSLYKEIAKNIVNPLEIVREALSNSHDAEAKNITIVIKRNNEGKFIIEIEDDGKAMTIEDLHRFFNLGDSKKDILNIGEKGLGTKSYLMSEKVVVITQRYNETSLIATMEEPWDTLLKNTIPMYSVEKRDGEIGKAGTKIIIEGYKIDNPEKYFNYDTVKDYVLWFTAGGSFKTYFANYTELHNYIKNMQIAPRIFIHDKIQGIRTEVAGTHQFFPPQENPKEDISEQVYKRSVNYCRHFGPYHRSTNINGEYVSFQMYGTISGLNCRKAICKLRQSETLKVRFGVYLAKDFIPFTKKSFLVTDPNYHHYHLLVNSQAFELTADRNNLSNQDSPKVKWIFDQVRKIINEDIMPISNDGYFKLRREEENQYQIKMKHLNLQNRLKTFDRLVNINIDDIPVNKVPDNEAQVVLLFIALLMNKFSKPLIKYIDKIGHYSHQSTTDMICINNEGKKVLVEIEHKLSNFFRHDHPYDTFDYIICWEVDLEYNEKRKLIDGNILKLLKDGEEWILKCGNEKVIPIIELKNIVDKSSVKKIN